MNSLKIQLQECLRHRNANRTVGLLIKIKYLYKSSMAIKCYQGKNIAFCVVLFCCWDVKLIRFAFLLMHLSCVQNDKENKCYKNTFYRLFYQPGTSPAKRRGWRINVLVLAFIIVVILTTGTLRVLGNVYCIQQPARTKQHT